MIPPLLGEKEIINRALLPHWRLNFTDSGTVWLGDDTVLALFGWCFCFGCSFVAVSSSVFGSTLVGWFLSLCWFCGLVVGVDCCVSCSCCFFTGVVVF